MILDDLKVSERKTKAVKTILNKINASDGSALIVLPVKDSDVLTSARNLKGVTAMSLEGINVYDLVRHKYFVSTESAINALQKKIKENKE